MTVNYRDVDLMRMIILSFQVAPSLSFSFSLLERAQTTVNLKSQAAYCESTCNKAPRRRLLILLLVSDTYSNKAPQTSRLSLNCTLMSCFTFLAAFWCFCRDSCSVAQSCWLSRLIQSLFYNTTWRFLSASSNRDSAVTCAGKVWFICFLFFCIQVHIPAAGNQRRGTCFMILRFVCFPFIKYDLQPKSLQLRNPPNILLITMKNGNTFFCCKPPGLAGCTTVVLHNNYLIFVFVCADRRNEGKFYSVESKSRLSFSLCGI